MFAFLAGALTVAAGIVGFSFARNFTVRRLRYVDGVRNPVWPWVIGLIAALIAAPVMWLLPLVGTGTAALFGISTGLGAASGVKAIRSGER